MKAVAIIFVIVFWCIASYMIGYGSGQTDAYIDAANIIKEQQNTFCINKRE